MRIATARIVFASALVFAAFLPSRLLAAERVCGGQTAAHLNPGVHLQISGPFDGSLDSIWVNQGVPPAPNYFAYSCNCENEDCYESNIPLPSGTENVWNPPAAGCAWNDHVCDCSQPTSSCCGNLIDP